MKLSTFTGTSTLLLGFLLTFGFGAPSYAQEQQSDKPKQQESGKPQDAKPEHEGQPKQQAEPPKAPNEQPTPDKEKVAKPPKQQPQAEQPRTEKQSKQAEKQNEQQPKDQEKAQKQQEKTQKEQQQYGEQRGYSQQQSAQQSGRGGGGRIPDDRFRAHFGREHHFHVGHPQIVEGRPHFEYGGYSFIVVQAWPADWGYDDDVYIVDDGGVYYLCDILHPGVQLELNVVL